MTLALEPFARASLEALAPLETALRDPRALAILLRKLGFEVDYSTAGLEALIAPFQALSVRATTALGTGRELIDVVTAEGTPLKDRVDAIQGILDVVKELIDVAHGLKDAILDVRPEDLAALPDTLNVTATWDTEVAAKLPEVLLISWMEQNKAILFGMLRSSTVIPAELWTFDPDRLGELIEDPVGVLAREYAWDASALAAEFLLDQLSRLLGSAGASTRFLPIDTDFHTFYSSIDQNDRDALKQLELPLIEGYVPGGYAEFGLIVLPMPHPEELPAGSGVHPITGLMLASLAEGDLSNSYEIGGGWTFEFFGNFDWTGQAWVRLHPTVPVQAAANLPSAAAGALLTFAPPAPAVLLGSRHGSRVEVRGFELSFEMFRDPASTDPSGDSDIILRARTAAEGQSGLALIISPGESNGFVNDLLGGRDFEAVVDLDASLSARHGFMFGASSTLSHQIPTDVKVGPVEFRSILIEARKREQGGNAVRVTSDIAAALGPFRVGVEGMGLQLAVSKPAGGAGNLGPFDVQAGLQGPSALAFSINMPAVAGGGAIRLDPASGRYEGALHLQVMQVGLTAFGILSLPPPDSGRRWSLLFSLSLRMVLPLGFGFTLEGVGGLIGINRTFEADTLTEGVRSGSLTDIVFPPRTFDLAYLLDRMETYFPEAPGVFVIGPFVKLSWGFGPILSAELGILLSIPTLPGSKVKIAIVGVIRARLPKPEAPILELNMAVLGFVDIAEKSFEIVASIYDSKILGKIELSGDMAMYARFGSEPFFLLSIGGFNPAFKPPDGIPARVTNLRRLRAAFPLGDTVECAVTGYFAVTSNTVQLGGQLDFTAGVRAFGATYLVEGTLAFNVLLRFSPVLRFFVDASASVTVSKGEREVCGVMLQFFIEGPKPWYGHISAGLRFFGINLTLSLTVGRQPDDTDRELFNVFDAIVDELRRLESWGAAGSRDSSSTWRLFSLTDQEVPAGTVLVRPDARLEVRQSVAPLGRKIRAYGPYDVDGDDMVTIDEAGFTVDGVDTDVPTEPVRDPFAPSHYDRLSDEKKLSAPSFEKHPSGVVFGGSGVTIPNASSSVIVEWSAFRAGEDSPDPVRDSPFGSDQHRGLDRLRVDRSSVRAGVAPVEVVETPYTVIDAITGEIAEQTLIDAGLSGNAELTYMHANEVVRTLEGRGRSPLRIVPTYAVVTP